MIRTILAVSILLSSCGKEEKSGGEGDVEGEVPGVTSTLPPQSLALDAADLPACTAEINKQLVYLLDTKEFQTCSGGTWIKIEISPPETIPPTPAPSLTREDLRVRLSTLAIGDKVKDLPQEVREALFSDLMVVTNTDYCSEDSVKYTSDGGWVTIQKGMVVSFQVEGLMDSLPCP